MISRVTARVTARARLKARLPGGPQQVGPPGQQRERDREPCHHAPARPPPARHPDRQPPGQQRHQLRLDRRQGQQPAGENVKRETRWVLPIMYWVMFSYLWFLV